VAFSVRTKGPWPWSYDYRLYDIMQFSKNTGLPFRTRVWNLALGSRSMGNTFVREALISD
jgi:hypothetical protein